MKVQILGFLIFGLLIASVFSQDPDGTEKSTTISAVLSGVDNASTIEVGFESTSRTFRYTPKATTTSEPDGDSSADPKDITGATT
ncbi:hypothetical protein L596_013769 [Steinernema carpocapsae]|uniref:Uncharacterized protein n=1 Tax=Steinernema carpocapsae TaxID=34508 RepID=A0A4V6A569_STECR|nr:hypothetical protein L596_013769 [Steinernema carpocapsae]